MLPPKKSINLSQTVHSRNGFTLIELVVVIGIAAILISLIFSATRAMRDRGEKVVCASNLRNIWSWCMLYAADNEGRMLSVDHPRWRNQYQILERLGPYVGNNYNAFHCPTTSRQQDYLWNGAWLGMCATTTIDGREEYTDYKLNDVEWRGGHVYEYTSPGVVYPRP